MAHPILRKQLSINQLNATRLIIGQRRSRHSGVISTVDKIHRLKKLVEINERADNEQRSEEIPAPEGIGAETVINPPKEQFIAYTVRQFVEPHKRGDPAGDTGEQEENQSIMHRMLPVTPGCNLVDFLGDVAFDDQSVNAEGDEGKEDVLAKSAVGS